MSAFDRPGSSPDAPGEVSSGVRKTPERSDVWPNIDNASDEDLIAFLGLDRTDRVKRLPDVPQRADKPHEVVALSAGTDYYPNIPASSPERLSAPVFDGPPARDQVAQGRVGDCGILSTLGAVAGHRPDVIRNAITQTGDGAYEVKLHDITSATPADPVARPTGDTTTYRVNDSLPVVPHDHKPLGVATDRCGWPALMEKVVAAEDQTWDATQKSDWDTAWNAWHKQSVDRERFDAGLPPSPADAPTGYNRLDIGSTAYQRANLLTQLTGEEAEVRDLPNQQQGDQVLLDTFRDQLADDKPVLVGSRGERAPGELIPFVNFAFGHAYEVTKVEGDKIHLSNPWGDQHTPPPVDAATYWEYFQWYNADGTRDGDYTTLK